MITPIVAALALQNNQEGRWVSSSVTPTVLAQKIDQSLATLKRTTVKYQYDFNGKIGRGFAICEGTIVAPGVFKVQVPRVNSSNAREAINYEDWVSDGRRYGMAVEPANVVPRPISKRPGAPKNPLAIWAVDFSKVIFSGLGQPTRPMSKWVVAAAKAGFKSDLLSRSIHYEGRLRTWYRLVLTKGNTNYELLVDGSRYLPVAVTNKVGDQITTWTKVDWNLKPGKSLDPSKVNFKKKGATLPLSPSPRRSKG